MLLVDAFAISGGALAPGDQARLEAVCADGQRGHPLLGLAPTAFAAHLGRVIGSSGPLGADLRAADLFLVAAVVAEVKGAQARFEQTVISALPGQLERAGIPNVDEVVQQVRERLLLPIDGRSRLLDYGGRGSLKGWVKVVALRLAATRAQREAGRREVSGDEVLGNVAARDDLELSFVRLQHREAFKRALAASLATLPARERAVLRLNFVDRLNVEKIGVLYGVHRATVARWISSARDSLLSQTRAKLREALRLSPAELQSFVDGLGSHLELSLSRVLKE